MILSYVLKVDGKVITWEKTFPFVTAVNGWLTPAQEKKAINQISEQMTIPAAGISLHRNKPRTARLNEINWNKEIE